MSLTRRRSDRPDPARRRLRSSLEALETRQLLTAGHPQYYTPLQSGVIIGSLNPDLPSLPIGNIAQLSTTDIEGLGNEGKSLQGRDRLGNQWQITVHGPGKVIVTDATPNDGVLDDDLDTIQIVGSSPSKTFVTGGVSASPLLVTANSGIVLFNKLIAKDGAAAIVLNGFVLTQTVPATNNGLPNSNTGVFLPSGVGTLKFTGIRTSIDLAQASQPVNIIIGDPNNPLTVKPKIRIDEITNTVTNSQSGAVPSTPPTQPTVNFVVNGDIAALNIVSAKQQTIDAALQFFFPIVGTTGRTSIQTTGIDRLNVVGSAVNTTVSRSPTPFSGPFSGVSHIGKATFGGNADGLGLDVNGRIGGLRFAKGLGSPVDNKTLPANYGIPDAATGYPSNNLIGGLVRAGSIGHVTVGPANSTLLMSNNPSLQQSSPGEPIYYPVPGSALSSAGIVTKGNIGSVKVLGNSTRSEIKTGFDLPSYAEGFRASRGASSIARLHVKGALINSVVSASYSAGSGGYGTKGSSAGPGSITGKFQGNAYNTGVPTILGNTGAGFYARNKKGYLPPG